MQPKTAITQTAPITYMEAKKILSALVSSAKPLTLAQKKEMKKKNSTEKGRLEILRQIGFD